MNRFKAITLAILLFAGGTSHGRTDVREFARQSLQRTQAAEKILDRLTTTYDEDLLREQFREPMEQLMRRWERNDSARIAYPSCAKAASILYRFGSALARQPDADWLSDQRRKYAAAIGECRLSINR